MRKSDFLDELRLQVGLAYDYAQDKDDFLIRVFKVIHKYANNKGYICIYSPSKGGDFLCEYEFGKKNNKDGFGLGFISLCQNQTSLLLKRNHEQLILAPIYSDNKLEYVISVSICNSNYSVTGLDIEFINELIRFIEVKRGNFVSEEE